MRLRDAAESVRRGVQPPIVVASLDDSWVLTGEPRGGYAGPVWHMSGTVSSGERPAGYSQRLCHLERGKAWTLNM